jgi:hypothetical protein
MGLIKNINAYMLAQLCMPKHNQRIIHASSRKPTISVYLSIYLPTFIYLSTYLPVCLSVYLSLYLSVCPSVCLSICLSISVADIRYFQTFILKKRMITVDSDVQNAWDQLVEHIVFSGFSLLFTIQTRRQISLFFLYCFWSKNHSRHHLRIFKGEQNWFPDLDGTRPGPQIHSASGHGFQREDQ